MAVNRESLSTGFYRTWDYGLASDIISNKVVFKGSEGHIRLLEDEIILKDHVLSVELEKNEDIFGPHVDYSTTFNIQFDSLEIRERVNTNFWELKANLISTSSLAYNGAITPSIDNLYYPNSYSAGRQYNHVTKNTSTYGDYFTTYDHTTGQHSLTFNLGEEQAAEAIKYFTQIVRGDGFTLPSDWVLIKPFSSVPYTHALLLGVSYTHTAQDDYNVSVTLQGYNNA
jgi:hypothetical protein